MESDEEAGPAKRLKTSAVPVTRKWSGAAVYKTKYQHTWPKTWPFVAPVKENQHAFYCTVCKKTVSCGHQGERDLSRHADSAQHQKSVKAMKNTQPLGFLPSSATDPLKEKVTRAEIKVTNLLVQHNIPLAVTDHLSPLFKDIFPDSPIAKGYASARTKTTCVLNGSLAPHFRSALVSAMICGPFAIAIDGSNDNGLEKMNPMTVRLFDSDRGVVTTQLLDMCLTSGPHSATAESIFTKMNEVLQSNGIPWANCVGAGVDNTSVNLGRNNSIRTRVLQQNPSTYFMGCPCHIVHNIALKASGSFCQATKFDVEELMIDNFYYFDKSTKRKSGLSEYCTFCDTQYRKVLKHVSTRWLSLEQAVDRALRQYSGLKSYFLSEDGTGARFDRLVKAYSDPMTEVYLLFYLSALQLFVNFNKFLQREDPIIPVISVQMTTFVKKLFGKFVTIQAIRDAANVTLVNFCRDKQLPDMGLYIGITTKQVLSHLQNDGDISPLQIRIFYQAVRGFYYTAAEYALANLPLKDALLQNASFLVFDKRESALFCQVEYFIQRYPSLLPYAAVVDLNKLEEEFLDYQLLEHTEIPEYVWESAVVMDGESQHYHRIDSIWAYLSTMRNPDGMQRFPMLAKVAHLVLVLPHSNAAEERVFSMVTKNKTAFRPNLKLDGTLSGILTVKLANPEPCHKYEPPTTVIETAKKATMEYNRAHSSSRT